MCQHCEDAAATEGIGDAARIISMEDIPPNVKRVILDAIRDKLGGKRRTSAEKMQDTLTALIEAGTEVDDIVDEYEAAESLAGRFMYTLEPKHIALALASYAVLAHRQEVADDAMADLDEADPVTLYATLAADRLDEVEDRHGPEAVPAAFAMIGGDPTKLDLPASDAGPGVGMYL